MNISTIEAAPIIDHALHLTWRIVEVDRNALGLLFQAGSALLGDGLGA